MHLIKNKKLLAIIFAALAVAILVFAIILPGNDRESKKNEINPVDRHGVVETKSLYRFSLESSKKNIIGKVHALDEADLRAEQAGTVTQVYKRAGEFAHAGTIIASVSNAQEAAGIQSANASVESAEAAVMHATAALNKVQGGTRSEQLAILHSSTKNAQSALDEQRVGTKNTLSSAYAAVDSNIVRGTDGMFTDADGANPQTKFQSTNYSENVQATNKRLVLSGIIDRHRDSSIDLHTTSSTQTLVQELTKTESELHAVKTFLDSLLTALDGAIATANVSTADIATYKATADAARSALLGTLQSLSLARSALLATDSALNIAQENESQGISGAQNEDVESAEASLAIAKAGVSSARAGLAAAYAVYEKTLIRTPVSGTVTTLSISKGDFVSMYQSVGVVASDESLEIIAHISQSDANTLKLGSEVIIKNKYTGHITNIATGLDPILQQIQIRISVSGKNTNLIHGESVSIEMQDNLALEGLSTQNLKLPLEAIKFEANRIVIFSVSTNNTLIAHQVELGSIDGELVQILTNLDPELEIVTDVRGLYDGQSVEVRDIST